jgi:hypothetical protein
VTAPRRARGVRTLAAVVLALVSVTASAQEQPSQQERLKLVINQPVEITCETKSVAVAPEAKTSAGMVRVKLEPKEASSTSITGTWAIQESSPQHGASFAQLQAAPCKDGCPLHALIPAASTDKSSVELWAPQRATLDGVPATTLLTVAAIDLKAMTVRISSFLDKQIAVLEQGDCKLTPPASEPAKTP